MSWFKKKKRQDDQKVLPNDVKAEDSLFGTRFYKQRGVQERAEIMLDANMHAHNKIFRWTRVLIIGSIVFCYVHLSIFPCGFQLFCFIRQWTGYPIGNHNRAGKRSGDSNAAYS